MQKINKSIAPDFFVKSKKRVKTPLTANAWSDPAIIPIRANLREYILLEEQFLLCCYCEQEIDSDPDNSNIDHFKKRDLFPRLTLDYNNLLISCNSRNQCSSSKDSNKRHLRESDYKKIVHPVIDDPMLFFDFLLTGDIIAREGINNTDKLKAEYTIELFGLNCESLRVQRRSIAASIMNLKRHSNLSLGMICDEFSDFTSFIQCIFYKIKMNNCK